MQILNGGSENALLIILVQENKCFNNAGKSLFEAQAQNICKNTGITLILDSMKHFCSVKANKISFKLSNMTFNNYWQWLSANIDFF